MARFRPNSRAGDNMSTGTRQPDDLMTRADELGDDGAADPAGCTGDEDAHVRDLQGLMSASVVTIPGPCQELSSR